jgi:hypothetical protein
MSSRIADRFWDNWPFTYNEARFSSNAWLRGAAPDVGDRDPRRREIA